MKNKLLKMLFGVVHFKEFGTFTSMQWRAQGGGGGARAPAPLRSNAKVPLRSGLCDMNDIVDYKNQYRRSLYAEYSVCLGHQLAGGHHPSCSKNKIKRDAPFPRPRPLALHVCGWMQMIIIDGQLCPWKYISSPAPRKEKKKMKTKPARHFQVGYIHN